MTPSIDFMANNVASKSYYVKRSVYFSFYLVIMSKWVSYTVYLLKINLWFLLKLSSIHIPFSKGSRNTSDYLNKGAWFIILFY